ncbi:ribonuclease H-like domain-containing protein [Tanacetum coccineum]
MVGPNNSSEDLISSLDLGNPLHLQNNDFTSSTIISVKLSGTENYRVWAGEMKLAINTRNKTAFIDGTCVKSAYANSIPLSNQWERCNSIVLSWLLNYVSEDLYLGQIFSNNAAKVWAELKETYDKLDGEFDIITKLPKCSCAARDDVLKHNKLMKLMQFLMGLNDLFQPIRSILSTKETLLEVEDAFAIVSREESYRGIASSSFGSMFKPQVSSFVGKSNNLSNNWNKRGDNKKFGNIVNNGNKRVPNPNLHCTNCGKVEHTIDRCFDIIGYPSRYKRNPGPKPNGPRTFNANSASSSNEKAPSGTVQANMADFEANQHMTISTLNMFGIIDISDLNLIMGHPNGSLAKIKYVANLKLSENVVLFDVLVVPEYCDLHLNKIVRTSNENGDLYMFDSNSPISSNCQTIGNQIAICFVSKSVWHNRLGHPSDQAVDVLQSDLKFTKDSHVSPCDIYHKAKQTRESFPLSNHKITLIGKHVHINLWGPYKVISKDGFRYFMTIVDDYTRAVWIYLVKTKDEVYGLFVNFINLILNQFKSSTKNVRSDNGTELVNNKNE